MQYWEWIYYCWPSEQRKYQTRTRTVRKPRLSKWLSMPSIYHKLARHKCDGCTHFKWAYPHQRYATPTWWALFYGYGHILNRNAPTVERPPPQNEPTFSIDYTLNRHAPTGERPRPSPYTLEDRPRKSSNRRALGR